MSRGDDSSGPADPRSQRRAFRIDTALPVRIRVAPDAFGASTWPPSDDGDARVLDTFTEDVSVLGMRFRAPATLAPGEPLAVAFELDDQPFELAAEVACADADQFGAGVGIEFVNAERNVAISLLSRHMFTLERERLPRVLVMYAVRCAIPNASGETKGASEECSPSFVQCLLERSVEPGTNVTLIMAIERATIRLLGRVVKCRQALNMWRLSVELDDPIPPRWADLVAERRSGLR